jgi:hypothetical protein
MKSKAIWFVLSLSLLFNLSSVAQERPQIKAQEATAKTAVLAGANIKSLKTSKVSSSNIPTVPGAPRLNASCTKWQVMCAIETAKSRTLKN